jgi:hypothetical protein
MLVSLNEQDELATIREHRYKYAGDNWKMGDTWWGWRHAQGQVKQVRV